MNALIVKYLAVASTFFVTYFFLVNSFYLLLVFAAMAALAKYTRIRPITTDLLVRSSSLAPPISILAPAYNEQETVVASVQSFLMLNYPSFEVVVINDGSKDETIKRLIEAFDLHPVELIYDQGLNTKPVRSDLRVRHSPEPVGGG